METLLSALAFYFVIVNPYPPNPTFQDWREAPGIVGYATYAACVEGQVEYRMNEEAGALSMCYAR